MTGRTQLGGEQVRAGGDRGDGHQAERVLGRFEGARGHEPGRHPPRLQPTRQLLGQQWLAGIEATGGDDDGAQRTVATGEARAVAVGNRGRQRRGQEGEQEEGKSPRPPTHATCPASPSATGSSSTASDPLSARRRAKWPPWAAATRRTTSRPWP